MDKNLGTLEEIDDLRTVWPKEASDFTPWLAANIGRLSKAVGIDIDIEETESAVGGFSVDIFAVDADTGRKIVIENQLEVTDHDHLGKLITYASGKGAELVIWIVKKAREEHRAAIEWLNSHTTEDIGFILCEVKLYHIGDSYVAPMFIVIEQPNNWAKEMKQPKTTGPKKKLPRITDMLKWGVVKAGDIITSKYSDEEVTLMENGHVSTENGEQSLLEWLKSATGWPSVHTYKFAVHKKTGKTLSELRKEYMQEHSVEE